MSAYISMHQPIEVDQCGKEKEMRRGERQKTEGGTTVVAGSLSTILL